MSNDVSSNSANSSGGGGHRRGSGLRSSANHPRYPREDLLADEEGGIPDLSLHRIVHDRAAAANEEIANSQGNNNNHQNTSKPKPTQTDEEIKQAIKEGRLGAPSLGRTQTSGDAPASQPAHGAKEAISVVNRDDQAKSEEAMMRDVVMRRSQAASAAVGAAEREILATAASTGSTRQVNERDAMVAANMVMNEKSEKVDGTTRESVTSACAPPSAGVRLNPDGTPVKSKLGPGGARPGAYAGGPGTGYGRVRSARLDTLGQAVEYSSSEEEEDSSEEEEGSSRRNRQPPPMNESDRHVVGDQPPPTMEAAADEEAPPAADFEAPVEVAPSVAANDNSSDLEKMVKKYKTILMVVGVVLVLVIIVAIVVPVVMSGGGDEEDQKNSGGVEAGPNIPPNVNVDPTLIPGVDESTWVAMFDTNSPQYKAYSWLIEDPNFDQHEDWRLRQRLALATFFYAMGGSRWGSSTWLNYNITECQWMTSGIGKICADDGTIQLLNVTKQRGFKGTLPPELSLLTNLEGMDFTDNVLGGDLSGLFDNDFDRPNFQVFWCRRCRLGGTFPSEFGQVANMQALYLDENDLTGELPSEVGLLTSLRFLEMHKNKFSGPMPTTIGSIPALKTLHLGGNQFTSMPSELGMLAAAEELYLSENAITKLPTEIGLMSQLKLLELDKNRLQGIIPTELSQLTNLERLLLNVNQFSGSIPSELGLLNKLNWLWLNENKLEGPIPTSLGQLAAMSEMVLEGNDLTLTIPSELGLLLLLKKLGLNANNLSGTLPSEIASLPQFYKLEVKHNPKLVQQLPEEFCSNNLIFLESDWCQGTTNSCCAVR